VRIIGTIEARMGSSRLPEKTLKTVYQKLSLLELVVQRFKLCKEVDDIIVATTIETQDDQIALWCEEYNVNCYRGSEDDVLDRVTNAAVQMQADVIVQMGADSAYLDYKLIDELVKVYSEGSYDYVCNDMKLTFPLGIYGHIVNVKKLIELNKKDHLTTEDREDVVRYIWEHPNEYRVANIEAKTEYSYPELRLTVDYPEDFELAQKVYSHFDRVDFSTTDIIDLYKEKREIFDPVMDLVQHSAPFIIDD